MEASRTDAQTIVDGKGNTVNLPRVKLEGFNPQIVTDYKTLRSNPILMEGIVSFQKGFCVNVIDLQGARGTIWFLQNSDNLSEEVEMHSVKTVIGGVVGRGGESNEEAQIKHIQKLESVYGKLIHKTGGYRKRRTTKKRKKTRRRRRR